MLGIYYMTRAARVRARAKARSSPRPDEVRAAYDHGEVDLQAKIDLPHRRQAATRPRSAACCSGRSSRGRSASTPINKVLDKKELGDLIDLCYRLTGEKETVLLADRIRTFGYTNATKAGISIALKDMVIPPKKQELLDERARRKSTEIENQYIEGLITDGERYNKVIDIWARGHRGGRRGDDAADLRRKSRRRARTASARRASSRPSTPSTSWPTPAPAAPPSRSASSPVCAA